MSSQRERAMKPTDLRGILRYVPMFRDHVFVIAVDGSIVAHENFANIVTEIAVLRSLSIKVVLVHGIGQQLVGLAGGHKIALSDVQGEGPTDAATMSLAREASALVSQSVLEHLSQAGLRCAITNAVRSTKLGRLKGVDHLYTGKVEKVDAAILKSMLAQDLLVEGLGGLDGLAADARVELRGLVGQQAFEVVLRQVELHDAVDLQAAEGGEVDELRGAERDGQFHRQVVAVDAQRLTFAVAHDRRDQG